MNPGFDDVLALYDEWCAHRTKLSAREDTTNHPTANEWAASDDGAVELMHMMASALRSAS